MRVTIEVCTKYSGTWKRLVREIREGLKSVEVMFEQKHERRSGEQGSKSVLGTYVVHFHPTPDFWT